MPSDPGTPTRPMLPTPSPARSARAAVARALVSLGLLVSLVAPVRAADPDYSGYEAFLRQYIKVVQEKGKPYDTRFDYEQLFIDEKIYYGGPAERLTTLHTQLMAVDVDALTPAERTAWAINSYNYLVIERLARNLVVPRRKLMRYDSPKQVNTDQGVFFGAITTQVGSQPYSLTGFSRRFVYGDTLTDPLTDGFAPREHAGDPRLMFALVHGSYCSGPILPWVYRGDSLEAQLDRAARLALALPTWLKLEPATGIVHASNRFFEERVDLGGPDMPGLMPLLQKYAPLAVRNTIAKRKLARPDFFFEPNWKLNQFDHPKPKLPGQDSTGTAKPARPQGTRG